MFITRHQTWNVLTGLIAEGALTAEFARQLAASDVREQDKQVLAAMVRERSLTPQDALAMASAQSRGKASRWSTRHPFLLGVMFVLALEAGLLALCPFVVRVWFNEWWDFQLIPFLWNHPPQVVANAYVDQADIANFATAMILLAGGVLAGWAHWRRS